MAMPGVWNGVNLLTLPTRMESMLVRLAVSVAGAQLSPAIAQIPPDMRTVPMRTDGVGCADVGVVCGWTRGTRDLEGTDFCCQRADGHPK